MDQEGEPAKDALSVPIKAFSYDATEITPQLMLKASRDPVLTNFIWSATWYFHEKFWLLGYPQGQKTTKVLSQWFLENTCLPSSTKLTLKLQSQEEWERAICTFGMLANDSWLPEYMISKNGQEALDFSGFIQAVHTLLQSFDHQGRLPVEKLLTQSLEALPQVKQANDFPQYVSGCDSGHIPAALSHVKTEGSTFPTKEEAKDQSADQKANTFKPITGPSSSHSTPIAKDNEAQLALLQATVDQLTQQNHLLQEQLRSKQLVPTSSTTPSVYEDQHQINMAFLKVIQNAGQESKKKDPTDKILQQWEVKILPSMVVQRVLKLNDFPTNTYAQQAIVHAASSLIQLYEMHRDEERYYEEGNLEALPAQFKPTSKFYSLALDASEALKMQVGSHAFPRQEKPYLQERKKVLQAVLGADVTQAELKLAYQQEAGGARGEGDQKKKKKKGKNKKNQNQNQNQNSGYNGGKRQNGDRGRSPSPSRDNPRSNSPSKKIE